MAIAVASTSNTSSYASGTSIVITKPTGLAVGDVLVAVIHIFGNGTVTTPAGWTQILTQAYSTTQNLTLLYKVADSSDAAASNFTFNLSGTLTNAGGLLRVTGCAFSDILGGTDSDTVENGSPEAAFTGGFTPEQASSLLIMAVSMSSGQQNGDMQTPTIATDNPSWTEAWEIEANQTDNNNYLHVVNYAVRAETSATGTYGISTGGYNSGNSDWVGALVSLNPASSATTTLDVAVVASSAPDPVVTGGMTATLDVATLATSAPDFEQSGQADWSSQQKSSAPTWTSQSKS